MKKLKTIFWIIWAGSLSLSLIDATISNGHILDKFGFSMKAVFMTVAIFSVVLLLFRFIKKDFHSQKRDRIITIFSTFVITFYIVLKIINRFTYSGFVFSKLHIWPDGFIWPALLSFLAIVVVWTPQIKFKKLFNIQSAILAFIFLLIGLNLLQIYKSEWQAFYYIVTNPRATYDDKMRYELCPIFYNYTLFINKYTSESSSLLMPPQTFPWPYVGNGGMLRYFVYPREITNGEEYKAPSLEVLKNIDYVLLNWGETEQTQGVYTHEWPKFDVKAEKIIFMNEDGSFGGEAKGDYHYNDYKGKRVWGLIVVKH